MQRNLDICPVLAAHSRTRAGIWAGLDALARCFVCDGEEAFGFGETGQDPGDAKSVAAYVPIAPASANLGHQMDSAVSPVSGARWGGFGGSVVEIMARGRGKEIKRQETEGRGRSGAAKSTAVQRVGVSQSQSLCWGGLGANPHCNQRVQVLPTQVQQARGRRGWAGIN